MKTTLKIYLQKYAIVLCTVLLYSCGTSTDKTETQPAETATVEDAATITLTPEQAKKRCYWYQ